MLTCIRCENFITTSSNHCNESCFLLVVSCLWCLNEFGYKLYVCLSQLLKAARWRTIGKEKGMEIQA